MIADLCFASVQKWTNASFSLNVSNLVAGGIYDRLTAPANSAVCFHAPFASFHRPIRFGNNANRVTPTHPRNLCWMQFARYDSQSWVVEDAEDFHDVTRSERLHYFLCGPGTRLKVLTHKARMKDFSIIWWITWSRKCTQRSFEWSNGSSIDKSVGLFPREHTCWQTKCLLWMHSESFRIKASAA